MSVTLTDTKLRHNIAETHGHDYLRQKGQSPGISRPQNCNAEALKKLSVEKQKTIQREVSKSAAPLKCPKCYYTRLLLQKGAQSYTYQLL
eukprot:4567330-Amphidinium_carterae.1